MADGFARNSITNAARSRTQLPSSIGVDFRVGPGAGIEDRGAARATTTI